MDNDGRPVEDRDIQVIRAFLKLEDDGYMHTKDSEVIEKTEMDREAIYDTIDYLMDEGVVEERRKIGNNRMYAIDKDEARSYWGKVWDEEYGG